MSEIPTHHEGEDFIAQDESQRIDNPELAHEMAIQSNRSHSWAAKERRFQTEMNKVGNLEAHNDRDGNVIEKSKDFEGQNSDQATEREIYGSKLYAEKEAIEGMSMKELSRRVKISRTQIRDLLFEAERYAQANGANYGHLENMLKEIKNIDAKKRFEEMITEISQRKELMNFDRDILEKRRNSFSGAIERIFRGGDDTDGEGFIEQ